MSKTETITSSYLNHDPHNLDTLQSRRLEKDTIRQTAFVKRMGAVVVAVFAGIGLNHEIQQNSAPNISTGAKVERASTVPGAIQVGRDGNGNQVILSDTDQTP